MSYSVQYAPASSTVFFPFATYGKTNGQSITLTGLAVTDIEIYKLPSMTQRASDNGYTLLDTDGIDLDSITGIHGFSVDLSDNSDSGFYAVGSWYLVIVSSITVDTEVVNFIAGMVRIMEAENPSGVPDVNVTHWNSSPVLTPNVAGLPKVDLTHFNGVAATSSGGRPEVNLTHTGGSAISQSGGLLNANMTQISGDGPAADGLEAILDGTGGVTLETGMSGPVGGLIGVTFPLNFDILAIDSSGFTSANIKKINNKLINTAAKPFDVEL